MIACLLAVPFTAAAQDSDYVVTAARWGSSQAAAVAAAGGSVVFGHDGAGVAIVRSSAPDFLSKLRASSAIQDVRKDMMIQWQTPLAGSLVSGNFTNTANNDRYFNNIQWAPQAVDAPAAWAEGRNGEGARVAVIDGGIWNVHPDLAPNIDVARSASFVPGQPFNTDTGTFWHVAAPGGDFALPGEDLCTLPTTLGAPLTQPCWVFDMVLSTNVGGWAWAAGTNMAAPAAAAVAAIIKARHPGMSLGALKTSLAQSALDLGKPGNDPIYGKGWVNALNACRQ